MSAAPHHRLMGKPGRVADVEALIREIQRYLSYLDALRRPSEPPAAPQRRKEGLRIPGG